MRAAISENLQWSVLLAAATLVLAGCGNQNDAVGCPRRMARFTW